MIFFSLLTTAVSSVFYGIVVTAVIMAILYFILKSLSRDMVKTPVFYITGVVLAVLLIIQASLMIGAMQAKEAADSAEIYLSQLLENQSGTVGANDSQRILDAVTDEFPVIGTYIGVADFSGHDLSEMSESMHETMIDYLNAYILHRILWIICIIIVACLVVMLYDKRSTTTGKTKRKVTMASRKNYDDF